MPELPEVETIVRSLRPSLVGKRIDAAKTIRKDIVRPPGIDLDSLLQGRTITGIQRRGKKIVFELNNRTRFYIHLGMSGRLTLERPNAINRPHTHMILQIAKSELRFIDPRRFGGVFWLGTERSPDTGLGPEPLEIRTNHLAIRLAKTHRSIKTALLDQKLLAGLGNIYVDESLFAARIHPLIPAIQLSQKEISRLNRSIKTILNRAIRHKGSTLRDYRDANGKPGDFQKIHRVYDRKGKPCLVCQTSIVRIVLGGRSTHFCPTCQNCDLSRG